MHIDNTTRILASKAVTGSFSKHRWEDIRVSADIVQDGSIQGGISPVRKKAMFNSQRGNSYSGLSVLNFKNYPHAFWQSCNFTSQMPHAWKFGTSISPHFHFMIGESDVVSMNANMFDPTWLEAGRISATGSDLGGGGYYRSSEYISVQGGLNYSVSYSGTQSSPPTIFWYTSSQTYISNQSGATAMAPTSATFARFVLHDTTGQPTQVQFQQSDSPTAYVAYEVDPATPTLQVGQKLLLEFEYAWINIWDLVQDTNIITINYEITQEDINRRHALVGFGEMEKPDGRLSSMIWGRFSRIRKESDWDYPEIGGTTGLVNDNCEGDLYFLEWDYHYQIDKTGTNNIYAD